MCACACHGVCVEVKGQPLKLALSFDHVASKNGVQASRLGGMCLYPFTAPRVKFLLTMTHTPLPHLSSEISSFPILIMKQVSVYTRIHNIPLLNIGKGISQPFSTTTETLKCVCWSYLLQVTSRTQPILQSLQCSLGDQKNNHHMSLKAKA